MSDRDLNPDIRALERKSATEAKEKPPARTGGL
jgi:hypothetical protein